MPIEHVGKAINILDYLRITNSRDYLLFSICRETGMQLDYVLRLKVSDLRNKKRLYISGVNIKLRKQLIYDIKEYCREKQKNEFMFQSKDGFNQKLSRKRAI